MRLLNRSEPFLREWLQKSRQSWVETMGLAFASNVLLLRAPHPAGPPACRNASSRSSRCFLSIPRVSLFLSAIALRCSLISFRVTLFLHRSTRIGVILDKPQIMLPACKISCFRLRGPDLVIECRELFLLQCASAFLVAVVFQIR